MSTETKASPTPGPWRCEPVPADAYADPDIHIDEACVFWVTDTHAEEVLVLVQDTSRGEAEANARLIAAAPCLLNALRDALAELSPLMQAYRPQHDEAICGTARAAIARAEGR